MDEGGRLRSGRAWWNGCRAAVLVALSCLLVLAGCSPPPPGPIPDLHIPGVVKIPGVAELEERTHHHIIESVAAFREAGGRTTESRALRAAELWSLRGRAGRQRYAVAAVVRPLDHGLARRALGGVQ
jgi:hypothetical protein